ncbi:serine/threonine dehydratase [Aestuariibacter salexigens]|uniref:serine/threonine dehydratase n=1 Tax=Aestuariibacter salexigens TaxID=226010 RepID=UPI00040667D5|nr:serine/threonine dehydratase [Aestuariibacter salexigens]
MLTLADIQAAAARIDKYIKKTPVFESRLLNHWLGHRVVFKAECLQRTGAFKLRGATNYIASMAQRDALPAAIVANSSGNHAQAVAYAARHFKIPATIYTTSRISTVKAAATRAYGAEINMFGTRPEADEAVAEAARHDGVEWIPPFNHPDIIAGQGTATLEALNQTGPVDAVFAPCGGGGLVSGALVATREMCPAASVFAAEPLNANDAARSLREGNIVSLDGPPDTLADGAATPSVGEHTFPYLQRLDGLYEVSEQRIVYWTQWLHHLLKLHIEPTCCMTMEAIVQWLKTQNGPKTVLVILSGGNIDQRSMSRVWQNDQLHTPPSLSE